MSKGNPSKLLEKLQKNDVVNIVAHAQIELPGEGHSELAMRVLREVCKLIAPHSKPPETSILSDDKCFLEVLRLCCQSITDDLQQGFMSTSDSKMLAVLYNILYNFVKNELVISAVTFSQYCLPIFEKKLPTMVESEVKITQHLSSLHYSLLVSLNDDKLSQDPTSCDKLSCLSLWRLMLRVCSLVQVDPLLPLQILRRMFSVYNLKLKSVKSDKILNFIELLFSSFETFCVDFSKRFLVDDASVDKLFTAFVVSEKFFVKSLMSISDVERAKHSMVSLTNCIRKLFKSYPCHIRHWELAVNVFDAFVFSLKCPPAQSKVLSSVVLCQQSLQKCLKGKQSETLDSVVCLCSVIIEWGYKHAKDDILKFFNCNMIIAMYKFSNLLVKSILSGSSPSCSQSGKQCSAQTDFLGAFISVGLPVNLIINILSGKDLGKDSEELLHMLQEAIQLQERILQEALDKSCLRTEEISKIFYDDLFFLGHLLQKSGNWEKAKECMLQALQYFIKVWKSNGAPSKDFPKAHIFYKLAICFENLKQVERAKAAVLLPLLLHTHVAYTPDLCKTWAILQDIKAQTSLEFLSQNFPILQSLCPSVCKKDNDKSRILLWELRCYAQFRMSRPEIIMKAWKELRSEKLSDIVYIEGIVCAAMAMLRSGSWNSTLFKDLHQSSCNYALQQELSIQKNIKALRFLGLLNLCKALCLVWKNSEENTIAVEGKQSFPSVIPTIVRKPEDVPDPNDSCNVVIAYRSLVVETENEIIGLLDLAVKCWEEAVCEENFVDDFDVSREIVGESLVQTASIFILFGHHRSAAKAWSVCLDFAKKMNRDDLQLQALSGLINIMECEQAVFTEAEALSLKLQNHPKGKNLLLCYDLSRVFNALRTKNYEEGFAILSHIIRENPTPTQSSLWCFIYAKLLRASYALVSQFTKVAEQSGYIDPVVEAQSGLLYALSDFKKKEKQVFSVSLCAITDQLLSISLWLGRLYCRIKQPRQARAFLKSELEVAQKLGLASRAAEFLCELARADLVCEMSAEAELKMDEVKRILGKCTAGGIGDNNPDDKTFLQIPNQQNPASPIFKERTTLLLFDRHPRFCDCYWCSSLTIQYICISSYQIMAKVSTLRFKVHEAFALYKHGVSIERKTVVLICGSLSVSVQLRLSREIVERHRKDNIMKSRLFLLHYVQCTQVAITIDYADMLHLYGKDSEAGEMNKDAFSLIQRLHTAERYLSAEAMEQNLCILQVVEDKKSSDQCLLKVEETSSGPLTPEDRKRVDVKTPENRFRPKTPQAAGKRRPLILINTPNQRSASPQSSVAIKSDSQDNLNCKENLSCIIIPIKEGRSLRSTRQKHKI